MAAFGEDLAVPVVLADDDDEVPRVQVGGLIEVRAQSLLREALHSRVEVDETEGDAELRPDRQADRIARCLDLGAFVVGQVERVLEHVVRVESDLLRLVDALDPIDLRSQPRGADHSQLERSSHIASLPAIANTMFGIPRPSHTAYAPSCGQTWRRDRRGAP